MRLPPHSQLMFPLLRAIADAGGRARPGELYDQLAAQFGLTADEREASTIADGRDTNLWERRVRWTRQTAVLKGLLRNETRGVWELTDHANVKLRNARRGTIVTVFETDKGVMLWARAEDAIGVIERGSVDLIFTSPPYPLLHHRHGRPYGNPRTARAWLDWMLGLCEGWRELLSARGSLMLNLGTTWNPGEPTTNDYIERLTIAMQDQLGYHFMQRLEWHNRTKLAQPMEWVGIRRVRVTPATEPVLWFSTTPHPKADNRNVLRPYSESMRRTLRDGQRPGTRPCGAKMRDGSFAIDHGGSIPTNVIESSHAASNNAYYRACRERGVPAHPATFPPKLVEFAVRLTTDPDDLVADFLAGSNTTGAVAEQLGRRWLACDRSRVYAGSAALRFPHARMLV